MSPSPRKRRVGERFAWAAPSYEAHAKVQLEAARRLCASIAELPLPPRPRILEIGCGTGLLTRELAATLGAAEWTITDIAAPMLAAAAAATSLSGSASFMLMDGEHPVVPEGSRYDLICSSLALQWFDDLPAGLARLAALLAPGGYLAIATLAEDTFIEWRDAHASLGLNAATATYPAPAAIGASLPAEDEALSGVVRALHIVESYPDGLDFLRSLKHIGADTPTAGSSPLSVSQLRRVLARFTQQGSAVTYHLAFGTWQRRPAPRRGVFITGTDTGVGKTLVSALFTLAWNAEYWKPLQTGLADEPGDTETVASLASLSAERVHPPAYALQASLSPWAAAVLENVALDWRSLRLPTTEAPLVVEGAGGLYVPVAEDCMMIDLIGRLGLPVVLTARSTLGTINHTLLSLQALRQAGITVLGVVLNGPLNPCNKDAIERFGQVEVLAQIPTMERVDAQTVRALADGLGLSAQPRLSTQ